MYSGASAAGPTELNAVRSYVATRGDAEETSTSYGTSISKKLDAQKISFDGRIYGIDNPSLELEVATIINSDGTLASPLSIMLIEPDKPD